MLNILLKARFTASFKEVAQSSVAHRVQETATLKQLITTLYNVQPYQYAILFRSDWNPICQKAAEGFRLLSNRHIGYQFYEINIDKDDSTVGYFGIKHPPTVLFYTYGAPTGKHIGADYEVLSKKLTNAEQFVSSVQLLEGTNQWQGPQEQWRIRYDEYQRQQDFWNR
ncbi:hypothetical protein pb186bvf_003362 [Paramecium bursaria]